MALRRSRLSLSNHEDARDSKPDHRRERRDDPRSPPCDVVEARVVDHVNEHRRHCHEAKAMAGMSERKLLSRIWPARSGRNGRKSEAAAMLTMFPRLALVVVSTYLRVFANVLLPSSMPRRITSRWRSRRTKSAASLATSTACSTE